MGSCEKNIWLAELKVVVNGLNLKLQMFEKEVQGERLLYEFSNNAYVIQRSKYSVTEKKAGNY